jgi:hypothetical protein
MASKRLVDATLDDLRELVSELLDEKLEDVQQSESDVMDLKQAAGYIGVHPKTLAKRARDGTVPARKIGPHEYRFFKSELRDSLRRVK